MSSQAPSASVKQEMPYSQASIPASAKMEYATEFHKFWYVGIKEHLAQLVENYPFVTTTIMLAAAFFGMMNIITFSPSCFIASVLLLSLAATLGSATYYAVKGSPINLLYHLSGAVTNAYTAFAWAVSSAKAAASI